MGILIALGTQTAAAFSGKRDYVRPGTFVQSYRSGLKRNDQPTGGGELLIDKIETTAEPTPISGGGEGDNPLPYPGLPVVEFEGASYRMTQLAATQWSAALADHFAPAPQAISEGWVIQDDFEFRAPLRRFVGLWIGQHTGLIFPEEDVPHYDAMMAAFTRGKQHVANTDYPSAPYGTYAMGWARPFLNPTGLSQRRGLPTADEIAFIKAHYWDPEQIHFVQAHFTPTSDPTLATPAKFREAHRLWASSERTRLLADGVPEEKWTMSFFLSFFNVENGMDFLRAGFEGLAEAQWPSVDIAAIDEANYAMLGVSGANELADAILEISDQTIFANGLPGPSSTFQHAQPVAGQPAPAEPGLPTPLKDHQQVQREQFAATILRLGVPAKYYQRGLGDGIDVVVYIGDSAPEIVGGAPDRSRHNLNNRKRQSWRLMCLAGTHLADPGLGVASDPELEALGLDTRSMVRLENGDVFVIAAEHLGLPSNEAIKLRVPESFKLVDRGYWSVEVSA